MARRARLQEFLGERYTDSKKLRAFVDDNFGIHAVNFIGWDQGVTDQTSELITWLEEQARVTDLWKPLREAFPNLVGEIDKLATEWQTDRSRSLARVVPGFLRRSRPLQIAIGGVGVAGIAIAVWAFVRSGNGPYTAIIVLDVESQGVIGTANPFAIEIDGTRHPLPAEGVSIGKGAAIPDGISAEYRGWVPAGSPTKVDIRLTNKLVSGLRITYESTTCPQPTIDIEKDSVWVVHLDRCQ